MRGKYIAIYVFIVALLLSGCSSVKRIDIEDRAQPTDGTSNMVIYTEYAINEHEIIVDDMNKGTLTPSSPLFLQLEPGLHKIHTVTPGGIIDHPMTFNFKANSTHYFNIEWQQGFWVFSVWIRPTEKVNSYLSNSNPWKKE
ncbi:MAG: hypothetical protein GY857_02635 [Desulfobacula sp.]|nr:hypothetical protein [Desulfobacula sp.]